MPCIVLLTDFGENDYFVGVMKGVIYGLNPVARIIDLTHRVSPQDVRQAAFVLWASRRSFPEDSIFVSVVDPGVGTSRRIICGKIDGQIFLAPDNGSLDYVVAEAEEIDMYEVNNRKFLLKEVSSTFHGRDIFAPVAAYLSRGVNPMELGPRLKYPKVERFYDRIIAGKNTGKVVYIDQFGNVFTSFLWEDSLLQKGASIRIHSRTISNFHESYAFSKGKGVVGVKGSSGLVELAVNKGDAAKVLKAKSGDKVLLSIRSS